MRSEIISPYDGQVIGMAVDQVVMPGFAGFHIGLQHAEEQSLTVHAASTQIPIDQTKVPASE
jgi:hypothetical protein